MIPVYSTTILYDSGKKRYFSCSPLSEHTQIQSLLAYKLLLINGCGTHENNICGQNFFWIGVCEFTNIIIVTKKSEQTSVRKTL